ncbi:MAG: hypothetical protein KDB16_18870, partial [Acidimicrobiales bacterium]|nr:hypothetical protein [Acidimicrobiales bacterium]
MAVELCKVSLWMEAMEPGRPLSFLEHRIVAGNGLLGATPELLANGVPDEAFKPLTGDDKAVVTSLRKRNSAERKGAMELFDSFDDATEAQLAQAAAEVDGLSDDDVAAVHAKERRWSELQSSDAYRRAVAAADTWCAAFVAPRQAGAPAITHGTYRSMRENPAGVPADARATVAEMASRFGFLHWHLTFLDVYGPTGRQGFDVVLGNPPWEKVQFTEKEFFAARAPELASLPGARRKAAIQQLRVEDPQLWADYQFELRRAEGDSHLLRSSGRFPLCGQGKVNTYAVFAEAMANAVAPTGRVGVIVPTGIATDDTTKHFFANVVGASRLASLFDFENAAPIFEGVHRSFKFCLLTLAGRDRPVPEAEFAFFAHETSDLYDRERRFTLSPDDLALINPNTRTSPVFRTRRDAELTKQIYRRVPVLIREGDPDGNPWGVEFQQGLFNMTSDSHLFRTADELQAEGAELHGNIWVKGDQKWLPLYEAKMAHHFNHRFGDYALKTATNDSNQLPDTPLLNLQDPTYVVQPRYWVAEPEVMAVVRRPVQQYLFGLRKTCRSTDVRTSIPALIGPVAVGDKLPLLNPSGGASPLSACLSSFIFDYSTRQKSGGTDLSFFIIAQLPVIPPGSFDSTAGWCRSSAASWINCRVLELTYTAWDLRSFAADLGYNGPPFRWDPARRELLRAELDAAFFHLYGIERDDV